MMTPLDRYKMLHRMGLVGPLPTVGDQRAWALIDDRIPPEGEADGEFTSFIQWVNKASSWIGYTGAKCYDKLDRRCRNGGDMQRARDEDAFPVRWYWPSRFPAPLPELKKSVLAVLAQLHRADNFYLPAGQIMSHTGKAPARKSLLKSIEEAGYITARDDGYHLNLYGQDQFPYELDRHRQLSYVRPHR
jgi:hypothetical protein